MTVNAKLNPKSMLDSNLNNSTNMNSIANITFKNLKHINYKQPYKMESSNSNIQSNLKKKLFPSKLNYNEIKISLPKNNSQVHMTENYKSNLGEITLKERLMKNLSKPMSRAMERIEKDKIQADREKLEMSFNSRNSKFSKNSKYSRNSFNSVDNKSSHHKSYSEYANSNLDYLNSNLINTVMKKTREQNRGFPTGNNSYLSNYNNTSFKDTLYSNKNNSPNITGVSFNVGRNMSATPSQHTESKNFECSFYNKVPTYGLNQNSRINSFNEENDFSEKNIKNLKNSILSKNPTNSNSSLERNNLLRKDSNLEYSADKTQEPSMSELSSNKKDIAEENIATASSIKKGERLLLKNLSELDIRLDSLNRQRKASKENKNDETNIKFSDISKNAGLLKVMLY